MFNIFNNKSAAEKARLYSQNNFKIDGKVSLPGDSVNELNNAKLTISNYIRHKNSSVRFFDPRELLTDTCMVSSKAENKLAKMVGIEVKKSGKIVGQKLIKYIGRQDNKPFIREVYEKLDELCVEKHPYKTLINKLKNYRKCLG